MKKLLTIMAFLLAGLTYGQSESTGIQRNPEQDSESIYFRRGTIRLNDGTFTRFRRMTLLSDSAKYSDYYKKDYGIALGQVINITHTKAKTGTGLAVGAGTGLLLGIAGAKVLGDFVDGIVYLLTFGYENDTDTNDMEAEVILVTTLTGAGIGALVGSLIRKEKKIYEGGVRLGMSVIDSQVPGKSVCPALAVHITF